MGTVSPTSTSCTAAVIFSGASGKIQQAQSIRTLPVFSQDLTNVPTFGLYSSVHQSFLAIGLLH